MAIYNRLEVNFLLVFPPPIYFILIYGYWTIKQAYCMTQGNFFETAIKQVSVLLHEY